MLIKDVINESRSVADVIREQQVKHGTTNNTKEMFAVGDKVCVIVPAQDHQFFTMERTFGYITEIKLESYSYGLMVGSYDRRLGLYKYFNFHPTDVIKVPDMVNKGSNDQQDH